MAMKENYQLKLTSFFKHGALHYILFPQYFIVSCIWDYEETWNWYEDTEQHMPPVLNWIRLKMHVIIIVSYAYTGATSADISMISYYVLVRMLNRNTFLAWEKLARGFKQITRSSMKKIVWNRFHKKIWNLKWGDISLSTAIDCR